MQPSSAELKSVPVPSHHQSYNKVCLYVLSGTCLRHTTKMSGPVAREKGLSNKPARSLELIIVF